MRYGFLMLMVLAGGGIAYATANSGPPSTQPSNGGSCCGMNMMGMGNMMGCMSATTKPAPATPDEHAVQH
ncbi:MAG: hypothetical protein M3O30_02450 [Planctomycetota bacterium]|nr:hypothetical protein [Planctomycetota bacterium]